MSTENVNHQYKKIIEINKKQKNKNRKENKTINILLLLYCSASVSGTDITTPLPVPIHNRLHETSSAVIRANEKPNFPVPSIFETYGSISTSCKCSYVWAWYNRSVESNLKNWRKCVKKNKKCPMKFVMMRSYLIETHTPNPVAAICRIWLSLRGCASKMCTIFNEIGSTI